MQEDSLESSLRRSKEAYVRIKMTRVADDLASPKVAPEHKVAVERIHLVISVLEGIERAKTLLQPVTTYAESQATYLELAEILGVLQNFQSSAVIAGLVKKIERRLEKLERTLDTAAKARITQALETGAPGWGKYLVNPKAKVMLLVNTVQEQIENKLVPQMFKATLSFPEPFTARVERLTSEVFPAKEVSAVMEVVRGLLSKEIRKAVASLCYANLKSLGTAHSRVLGVVKTCKYLHQNYTLLTGSRQVDSALMEMVKSACKTLFMEAESAFSLARIDEKTLQDPALSGMLEIVQEIDKTPEIFPKWSHQRQPLLRTIRFVSREKSQRIKHRLKSLLALDNSMQALKQAGATDLPSSKQLLGEISAEINRSMVNEVESARKGDNKVARLLRYVETFAAFSRDFHVSSSHRKTLIATFKAQVHELGQKLGNLDDISEHHLNSTIEHLFREHK